MLHNGCYPEASGVQEKGTLQIRAQRLCTISCQCFALMLCLSSYGNLIPVWDGHAHWHLPSTPKMQRSFDAGRCATLLDCLSTTAADLSLLMCTSCRSLYHSHVKRQRE